MIRGVTRRSTFELFRRGTMVRAGPLTIRYVATGADPAEVAFSIRRRAANAVRRNRCRRRLRAALAARSIEPGAYLVTVRDDSVDLPYREWDQWLTQALATLAQRRPAP